MVHPAAALDVASVSDPTYSSPKIGPDISKIYVLSDASGCLVTTYTPDGQKISPTIVPGGAGCNGIAVNQSGKIFISY
jgi:hypothetical protein